MRTSRVLLAGVAVAAAAVAASSAFTDSNPMPASKLVAGYGEVAATGATVTDIHYTLNGSDKSIVDAIVFTTSTDVTGEVSTLTLKKQDVNNNNVETAVANYPMACDDPVVAGSDWTITCNTSGHPLAFADFDLVGLTVSNS